ncbi:hypothetical protein [Pseudomonas sp.]|uniref:hypothetical protein n=1 Tax=Pseudomonas sp. TaxID=306 RepID=UPI001B0CEE5C|nr:hypothetical protein [Pseudomonas sp.]MBO9549399.1 hypothetical protein [Pseudomonas sp.]
MKTTRICLTLITCAFVLAYVSALTQPLPVSHVAYYCQPGYASCYMPALGAMRLLP